MRKPRRRRKKFPYYKIQVYNEIFKSWKDIQRAFDTVETARDYIEKRIGPQTARIMVVERNARRLLDS